MEIQYKIGGELITCNLHGESIHGEPIILFDQDDNLLENVDWKKEGYTITPFVSENEYSVIISGLTKIVAKILENIGVNIDESFCLEKYHLYVNDEQHLTLAQHIQFGWHVSEFPIDFNSINLRISDILGIDVTAEAKHVDFYNFFIRIARPGKEKDNNPPHRDVWLDRLRNAVNIYVPICGSTEKSSLPILTGSHLIPESQIERTSKGAYLNNTQYTVPCVLKVNNSIPELIRPNPKKNEMMVFSPYLVHGGGYNLNTDETRVSLEVRFFRVKNEF